ncbi:MAG TPA: aminotransferase class III-fold pyridoxal phosphate-dependent enzyme [Kofleriaceae bacterium]|nr:aminotransferase class III-fold pyridoxal phosphate-dependent enzyme [Kofleriaceae bacterium]
MSFTAEALAAIDAADLDSFRQAFAAEAELGERAHRVLAGGSAHDSQTVAPFQPFFVRAQGPFKWGASGRRFVDFWTGHGSLLFGHSFAPVLEAIARQLPLGMHLGGLTPDVVRWAELVCELVPSAERVRFTSSGTEATLLAIRVARAFTGKQQLLKFSGHFHGWHDEALAYVCPPEAGGLNLGAADQVALADPTDAESVIEFIAETPVAAVILEPGGGSSGELPFDREFLAALRKGTQEHGTLLIFDEVVSGFRYSPGGVQAMCGVLPDLTVLGKILCGGLPGAAIAGRREIMDVFGKGTRVNDRSARVLHTGTFNANPLAAAAGAVTLEHARDGAAQAAARRAAARIADDVNQAAERRGVDVKLYTNDASILHIMIGAATADATKTPMALHRDHPERYAMLRRALLVEGVDCHPAHGWVSAAHDDAEAIDATTEAFARAFDKLAQVPGFAR